MDALELLAPAIPDDAVVVADGDTLYDGGGNAYLVAVSAGVLTLNPI